MTEITESKLAEGKASGSEINDELRIYAIKVATGRASVADETRLHQIGEQLAREAAAAEKAAKEAEAAK